MSINAAEKLRVIMRRNNITMTDLAKATNQSRHRAKTFPFGEGGPPPKAVVEEECRSTYIALNFQIITVIARSEATRQSVPFVPTAHQGERIAPQAFPSVTTPVCGLVRNDREWETLYVFAD